jgi:hypothetical protein
MDVSFPIHSSGAGGGGSGRETGMGGACGAAVAGEVGVGFAEGVDGIGFLIGVFFS